MSEDADGTGVQAPEEAARSLIASCKFSMRLQMVESARKQVGAPGARTIQNWRSLNLAFL